VPLGNFLQRHDDKYISPRGYHTPSASSVYCIIEKVAGASKGLRPMYMSWKVKAAFKRSAWKNWRMPA
jgi:hypothetical protein